MRLLIIFILAFGTFTPASAAVGEAGVYFVAPSHAVPASERLTLSYNEGLGWRAVRLRTSPPKGRLYDYLVLPYGKLRVQAVLRSNGSAAARLEMNVPVEGGRYYDIHSELSPTNPTRSCKDCSKALSAPISGRPEKHLWLWYRSKVIPHPFFYGDEGPGASRTPTR